MPDPFATVADLESRWRPLSSEEQARAEVLLADASAILRAGCSTIDARIAEGTLDPELPEMVTCSMVRRAMIGGESLDGATSTQQTAGPFSASIAFANPLGNLYTTKAERALLGCAGSPLAFEIDTLPPRETAADVIDIAFRNVAPQKDGLPVERHIPEAVARTGPAEDFPPADLSP
jgi:hypothetical protein